MQNYEQGSLDPRGKQGSEGAASILLSLIDSTQDPIWSVDIDYRLVTFNKAFAGEIQKIWGMTVKAGMLPVELMPAARAALWPPLYERALTGGPFRTEHAQPDGRWLELSLNPIAIDGAGVGISVFGKDITERKLAEEFRNASEERFRTVIDEAPSAIAIGRDGVNLYVNQKFVEMFGLADAAEAAGRLIGDFWAPEWRALIDERNHLRTSGIPVLNDYEAMAQRADDTLFSVRVAVTMVDLADGPASLAIFTDISERKAVESALRESEARLRSYFDLPMVGMVMTSMEKGFIAVNDRLCEMLGYSREELLETDWTQITHRDDLKVEIGQFTRLMAGEMETYSLDKRFIRKDGQTMWATISVGCDRKPDGSVDYVCATVQDISERKRAEEGLLQSEARFRALFESAPTAIAFSRNGTVLYVNPKYLEMIFMFRSADEVVGRPVIEHWVTEDRAIIEASLRRHAEEPEAVVSFEAMALRADGSRFPVHAEAANVDLPDGKASFVFLTDITARKAAEEALQKAEQEYRGIFEEAPEGIFKTTREGKVLSLNPTGARILGYASSDEAVNTIEESARSVWLQPEDRESYRSELEERGEIRNRQYQWKPRDGTPIWVSVSVRRVCGKDGETLYYQGYFENLSEKKRLESELVEHLREVQLLSEMSGALLQATSEEVLLREYCRIVVEVGGYRMAWVGFAETGAEKRIVPVAHYGHEDGYLQIADLRWDDSERGEGPAARSVKSGKIEVVENVQTDPRMGPWRAEAAKRGYQSSIAIPFHQSAEGMACLTAYGSTKNVWSAAERRLMEQIGAALGFGITTLRTAIAKDSYQQDLHASLEQTIDVISETVDQRDPYTAGHQRRVADLSTRMATRMGLDRDRIQGLRLAAVIHDLGKIGIPAEILAKPGRLTPIQFELIKEHVQLGYEIMKNVKFPWPIADIIRQHHERLDGSGYPQGLQTKDILPEARILAVADVVEAMSSHRPYRAAQGIEVALEEVIAQKGRLYDPEAVDACVALFRGGYVFPA